MKKQLIEKVFDLENECVEQSKKIIKEHGDNVDLGEYVFYMTYCGCEDVVSIRVDSVGIDCMGLIIFYGSDSHGTRYKLDEGDDIVNLCGFDLYIKLQENNEIFSFVDELQ